MHVYKKYPHQDVPKRVMPGGIRLEKPLQEDKGTQDLQSTMIPDFVNTILEVFNDIVPRTL